MSQSSHVVAFRPPDETWKKMKQAWDACAAAGVRPPQEVEQFFGGEAPDENGIEIQLDYGHNDRKPHACCTAWERSQGEQWGYEIDLSKLPPQITKLRFYNSI